MEEGHIRAHTQEPGRGGGGRHRGRLRPGQPVGASGRSPAPLGTHDLAATVYGHPAPAWGPEGAGGRGTAPEPSSCRVPSAAQGETCLCPGDGLWAGLPACSRFLHDVISCGAGGAMDGASAAKCQVPESRGSCVPAARPFPPLWAGLTAPDQRRVAGELTRAPSSHWNCMGTNTQPGNYINGTDADGPSLSALWDRQPRVAEAVAWARVSAPYPHRCHLGQVTPHPHPAIPLGTLLWAKEPALQNTCGREGGEYVGATGSPGPGVPSLPLHCHRGPAAWASRGQRRPGSVGPGGPP